MRPGGEKRGNSRDRKARKLWLLSHFGDGTTAPCIHCGRSLTYHEVEADRIVPGGSYRRDNVQPSCGPCNRKRGTKADWQPEVVFA